MIEVSDAYAAAISKPHTPIEYAEVIDANGDTQPERLAVRGEATEDASAEVRLSCDVELVDPTGDLRPLEMEDRLAPFGTRVRLSKGMLLPDGTEETQSLGTFFITASAARMSADDRALIPITGYDRTKRLARPLSRSIAVNPALAPSLPQVIAEVCDSIDPSITTDPVLSPYVAPILLLEAGDDAMAKMRELADAIGYEVYMSRDDELIIAPTPLFEGQPVWTVSGDAVIDGEISWDGDNAYNGVIVVGQHSSMPSPVRGEAWDMDPTSVTYRYGGFGESAVVIRTEKVTDAGQATDVARAQLQRALGRAQEVPLTLSVSYHHLLTGDLLRINVEELGILNVPMLLERIRTPLGDPDDHPQIVVRKGVIFDAQG